MVLARAVFALLAQGAVALVFVVQRHPSPGSAAGAWWTVYGTLVDIGCLVLLFWLTRRERIRLGDLVGFSRNTLLGDVLLGAGFFVVLFLVVVGGGSLLASLLVYGTARPNLPPEVFDRTLPLWGVLYSRMIWWVIWSFTEQVTYQGYALPRLQVLTGRSWLAILWVAFGWALQHCFLPFSLEWKQMIFRFLIFVPLVTVMPILYLRLRRLVPFVIAQWGMDFILTLMTIR
jgi:Type II CAAX prenyl endopeptidase Rce1-like